MRHLVLALFVHALLRVRVVRICARGSFAAPVAAYLRQGPRATICGATSASKNQIGEKPTTRTWFRNVTTAYPFGRTIKTRILPFWASSASSWSGCPFSASTGVEGRSPWA